VEEFHCFSVSSRLTLSRPDGRTKGLLHQYAVDAPVLSLLTMGRTSPCCFLQAVDKRVQVSREKSVGATIVDIKGGVYQQVDDGDDLSLDCVLI
jgi:hypothetical protein